MAACRRIRLLFRPQKCQWLSRAVLSVTVGNNTESTTVNRSLFLNKYLAGGRNANLRCCRLPILHKTGSDKAFTGKPFVLAVLALSLFKKKEEMSKEEELIMMIKYAKLAEMKKDYKKAHSLYHQSLAFVDKHLKDKTFSDNKALGAKITIYSAMANLYFSMGRLEDAENLFKETIRGLMQNGVKQNDNAILELSLKLAIIYALRKEYDNSEAGFRFCIDALEKKVKGEETNETSSLGFMQEEKRKIETISIAEAKQKSDDLENDEYSGSTKEDTLALLGMCWHWYFKLLLELNRLQEAQDAIERALAVGKAVFTPYHNQVAVLYNDLASVASAQNKLLVALEAVDQAIKIGTEVKSEDLAVFYCNLGKINFLKGDLSEAKRCCKEAILVAKKLDDKEAELQAQECLKDIELEHRK